MFLICHNAKLFSFTLYDAEVLAMNDHNAYNQF